MASDDFDVSSLAAYLHLSPQQVSRLADRGKLPGRKIGGQWKFAQADIHHWLEDRIGLSDEEELVQVEDVLERADRRENRESVSLYELLPVEAIALPLPCRTRGSVIQEMVKLAAQNRSVVGRCEDDRSRSGARGIASNCAGQRCCSAAPAATLGVDSGGTAAGFGPDTRKVFLSEVAVVR